MTRRVIFTIGVVAALILGFYSLFLASVNAGKVKPLAREGLIRTAAAGDKEQISLALGTMVEPELVYVVVGAPLGLRDPEPESIVRQAAQSLIDSGLTVSVRRLEPIDPDYATIVEQNRINQFPAVLLVKKKGGIVLVTDSLNAERLLIAYHDVWGKKSDCGSAKNAIY